MSRVATKKVLALSPESLKLMVEALAELKRTDNRLARLHKQLVDGDLEVTPRLLLAVEDDHISEVMASDVPIEFLFLDFDELKNLPADRKTAVEHVKQLTWKSVMVDEAGIDALFDEVAELCGQKSIDPVH